MWSHHGSTVHEIYSYHSSTGDRNIDGARSGRWRTFGIGEGVDSKVIQPQLLRLGNIRTATRVWCACVCVCVFVFVYVYVCVHACLCMGAWVVRVFAVVYY